MVKYTVIEILFCPHRIEVNGCHGDICPSFDKNNMNITCPHEENVRSNGAFTPATKCTICSLEKRPIHMGQPQQNCFWSDGLNLQPLWYV